MASTTTNVWMPKTLWISLFEQKKKKKKLLKIVNWFAQFFVVVVAVLFVLFIWLPASMCRVTSSLLSLLFSSLTKIRFISNPKKFDITFNIFGFYLFRKIFSVSIKTGSSCKKINFSYRHIDSVCAMFFFWQFCVCVCAFSLI